MKKIDVPSRYNFLKKLSFVKDVLFLINDHELFLMTKVFAMRAGIRITKKLLIGKVVRMN